MSTSVLWCLGIGLFLRSTQYFSPKTAFTNQFSKLLGFRNKVGFTMNQIISNTIGITQYQPIHTRDQMATIKKGKVANRVQID